MTQTPFTVNEPNGNIYEKYKLRLANEPSRARTCDQRIKSPLFYQLSYRFKTCVFRGADTPQQLELCTVRCYGSSLLSLYK